VRRLPAPEPLHLALYKICNAAAGGPATLAERV
jgi:hypothetical protein